jgi:hypothetical protein
MASISSDQIFARQSILPETKSRRVIGGRSAELMGIDGSNGNVLWRQTKQPNYYVV